METSRLKNIIILTLALVNLFLIGTLAFRGGEQYQSQRRTVEELVTLFSADGVALSEDAVSFTDPPGGRVLTRSLSAEKALAASLLGDGQLTDLDEGGGIHSLASSAGRATFLASGSFEITGYLGDDPAAVIRRFCKDYGYGEPTLSLDASGTGAAEAPALYEGYPVVGCAVTFRAEKGMLRSVSGVYLPDGSAAAGDGALLSCVTALTAFWEARRSSGVVVTSVTGAYPCYTLQSTTSAPMSLVPAWCIVTDTANYYVNCSTAAVTHD